MWGRLSATLPQALKGFSKPLPGPTNPTTKFKNSRFPKTRPVKNPKETRTLLFLKEVSGEVYFLSSRSFSPPQSFIMSDPNASEAEKNVSPRALYTPRMGTVFR